MPGPIKSDDLFSAWARGHWKPFYLFAGQEDFLIEQAIEQATRHWLGENPDPLSLDRLDTETHTVPDILQAARTVPFFGGKRVIRVLHAAGLSNPDQQALAEALGEFPPEIHGVFVWGKEWRRDDAQKPLAEALLEKGQVVIFWPLFTEQAARWCLSRAKHYQKTIAPATASWLVQHAGEGLRNLDQELAKCSAYVGERPQIDLEDIQSSFGYRKASSPFDWISSIRQKKPPLALQVLDHLLKEGEEPVRLLALLSRSARDWLTAKRSGESAAMLAMRFHLKRGEESRFVQELARWTEEDLTEGLGRCLEAEQSIKSGKETPEMALTLLTLSLCSLQTADVLR